LRFNHPELFDTRFFGARAVRKNLDVLESIAATVVAGFLHKRREVGTQDVNDAYNRA
jgi:hypothetical protein